MGEQMVETARTITQEVELRDKGEKSHAVQRAAESRQRCDCDVQEGVESGGDESDLALREGKSDQGHHRSRAVVQASCEAVTWYVVGRHGGAFQHQVHGVEERLCG